jgi:hypothetical protein
VKSKRRIDLHFSFVCNNNNKTRFKIERNSQHKYEDFLPALDTNGLLHVGGKCKNCHRHIGQHASKGKVNIPVYTMYSYFSLLLIPHHACPFNICCFEIFLPLTPHLSITLCCFEIVSISLISSHFFCSCSCSSRWRTSTSCR